MKRARGGSLRRLLQVVVFTEPLLAVRQRVEQLLGKQVRTQAVFDLPAQDIRMITDLSIVNHRHKHIRLHDDFNLIDGIRLIAPRLTQTQQLIRVDADDLFT